MPYSTCEVAGLFVDQFTCADEDVMFETLGASRLRLGVATVATDVVEVVSGCAEVVVTPTHPVFSERASRAKQRKAKPL